MNRYKGLSEFVGFNSEFRNAINLDLNLNHREKLLSYIPTKSSVDILKRYLKAVQNNMMHSSMLVGPYGKGKSHLLLVLLAILSMDREDEKSTEVFYQILEKIKKVDDETADYMQKIWDGSQGKFLPVIVNCQDDVNQAFLLGLNKALNNNGLSELTPKTDYIYAVEIIENWKDNYKATYERYHEILKQKKVSLNAMKAELMQYNKEYLELFKEIYPELTSGSVFNPLAEADVTRIYMSVADQLREEYGYRGIYIVFDEFSKFIEGQDKLSAGLNMKLVQDVCEMAGDAKDPQIYVTLVAHKPIKEYGNKLKQETINLFTGIEGRLDAEVLFVTSAKNNYELIENAIVKKHSDLEMLPDEVRERHFSDSIVSTNFAVPVFESEFTFEDFRSIVVEGCYPLTPISSYLLLSISEKVAQNERTLFTFISKDEENSMPGYIRSSVGRNGMCSDKWAVTPDLIYDYFTSLFKDESDDTKSIYQRSLTAIDMASKKYKHNELPIRIIKTLAVMMIAGKEQELPWNGDMIRLAVNMDYSEDARERFANAMNNLMMLEILDTDGNNFYKFKTIEGKELETVIEERWRLVANENRIKENLQQLFRTKYVFPKKYNYEYGMTRYFRYVFYNVEDFLKVTTASVFFENTVFCDGKIICLFQLDDKDYSAEINEKLKALGSHKIVVMYSHRIFELQEEVLKLQVVQDIRDDYSFIEKNAKLQSEIQGVIENLEDKLSMALEAMYGRFGDYTVSYYLDYKVNCDPNRTISECIDDLCYRLYDRTPVINNEFVNKQNITTGATKTARKNVMEKLINRESTEDYLNGTSQDATIYRALFVRNGLYKGEPEEKILAVIDLFERYISDCTGKRLPLAKLLNVISTEPYGMRLGLIPIYLAYVIGKKEADVIVYFGDKEIPLTSDTIINMCDYPEQYEVFVSEMDAKRNDYLEQIIELFGIRDDMSNADSRINKVLTGMQKWYRALPQVTVNSKGDKTYFTEAYLSKAMQRMNNILQRYEVNPYEAIFVQIPEAFASSDNLESCAKRLRVFKDKVNGYYNWMVNNAISETKELFSDSSDSLYHIMRNWYQGQSELAKGIINDQAIASFMKVLAAIDTVEEQAQGDVALIDKIVKAVSGVHIDYWNSNSLQQYKEKLQELKSKVESIKTEEKTKSAKQEVYVSRSGQQFYYEPVDNDDTEMFRDVLVGTIEDFEGLGKNELIAVLLDEVERILKEKE